MASVDGQNYTALKNLMPSEESGISRGDVSHSVVVTVPTFARKLQLGRADSLRPAFTQPLISHSEGDHHFREIPKQRWSNHPSLKSHVLFPW